MRICTSLCLLLPFLLSVDSPAAAQVDPLTCAGYPESRVFLESQSWWSDEREPFPGAHIHLGTCFPLGGTIAGSVTFDVRLVLHDDPGETSYVRVTLWEDDPVTGDPVETIPETYVPLVWRCSPGETCSQWQTVSIDTTQAASDGRKEFRFTLNVPVTPEGPNAGNRQFQTTRWHATLANGEGRPVVDYQSIDRTGAAGWYTDSGYTNVRIRGAHALQAAWGSVCGTWSPEVRGEKDRFAVAVDAGNHGQDPGVVFYDGVADAVWRKVDIDTAQLGDGPHKLFLRADDTLPNGMNSGVFVLPFEIAPSGQTVETVCGDGLDDDCDGFNDCRDSDCILAPECACDDDGICEIGEDCDSCPGDCPGGTCGNGTCDVAEGEDCASCPEDCAGVQNGHKQNRWCCGDGDGDAPVGCGDARCTSGGFACSEAPAAGFCCGNDVCESSEDRVVCALDCGGPPVCGDGTCDVGETPCSCADDCGAPPIVELACFDGVDDDCDAQADCNDVDCVDECTVSCVGNKGSCSSGVDCCSGNCKNGTCRGE